MCVQQYQGDLPVLLLTRRTVQGGFPTGCAGVVVRDIITRLRGNGGEGHTKATE
jgi:hypothetical protein